MQVIVRKYQNENYIPTFCGYILIRHIIAYKKELIAHLAESPKAISS